VLTAQTSSGTTETIHSIPVNDAYRWLEDRRAPNTEHWIQEQRGRFDEYVSQLPSIQLLRSYVAPYVDIDRTDKIAKVGGRYFIRRRLVGKQQASIFVKDSIDTPERLLVDPSKLGQFSAVDIYRLSRDGSLLAYELKEGGEHTKEIYIVDVEKGIVLPDHLQRGEARGFTFSEDCEGFYFCHDVNEGLVSGPSDHRIYYHRFDSGSEEDVVLFSLPREGQLSKLVLTSEGRYLGAHYTRERNGVVVVEFYVAERVNHHTWNCVCRGMPAPFIPFFVGKRLLAYRAGNSNGEIVELDLASNLWPRDIVPESELRIRQWDLVGDRVVVTYLCGTESLVRIWSLEGEFLGALPLTLGSSRRLIPTYSDDTDEYFLSSESYSVPPRPIRYRRNSLVGETWGEEITSGLVNNLHVRRVSYRSKDGVEVAMSLMSAGEIPQLKLRPTVMTAYGGFGHTITPQFSAFISVLLKLGFLFALPEIRGGGERGAAWHEAARGRRRQVAFDDFISAAEWLCEQDFTLAKKLALFGGSNSGLLVGAAITQRPDLFGAALCIAPLLDMVRYHLFDRARVWSGEYGTSDDPEDFRALLAYSPYHRIQQDVDYPAVLFVTGDQDTRCNPAHARKMAAYLMDRHAQKRPILIDHSAERGHSPNMPLSIRAEAIARRIAFLCQELGVNVQEDRLNVQVHS
jgi:prolyl oligopeptidase